MSAESEDREEHFRMRTELFTNFVTREGASLLPGSWGGENGQDRLAYKVVSNGVILLLGIKLMRGEEGVQLDTDSLGGHMQLSPSWIEALLVRLGEMHGQEDAARLIWEAEKDSRLTTAVMILDADTQKIRLLPVNARTFDA